jgi:hypothetical protein
MFLRLILAFGFLLLVPLLHCSHCSGGRAVRRHDPGNGDACPDSEFRAFASADHTAFRDDIKFLSDAKVAWRHVWIGAFITAQMLSFGADFTQVYANRFGQPAAPCDKCGCRKSLSDHPKSRPD